ncbi:Isoleucine--tRNA ligase [Candidatus Nasuia deltocephalinicola]|nr:Isoleucine--tRNA ligase [Candidatus Nasuia deltocephalinicola]
MENKKKYSINLLESNFKMKGNINLLQSKIIYFWKKKKIYKKYFLKKKYFILHDGPPFANGEIHLGHIFNKILKDIIIKYKNILNYKSPYILGWDCFGLPIENKFKKNQNLNYKYLKKYNLIKNYVEKIIENQKKSFYNLGIISNYNNIYKTINYRNSSEEIRIIFNFDKKKYLYRDYKLMYWCYKCNSFLPNSDIKFLKKIDFSMIIIFLFNKIFFFLKIINIKKKYIIGGVLIWTTLPWTLLLNQGLCFSFEKIYVFMNTIKGLFIINLQKYIFFKKKKNYILYLYKLFIGFNLSKLSFINPLFKINKYFYKNINIFIDKKLIKNLGTEILHISPNHGLEDYIIYKKNKYKNIFKIINLFYINGYFKYNNIFYKKNINFLKKYIINYIIKNNKYFFHKKYKHKCIICKKDNNFIIYKIIKQWYINFKKNINKNINKKINKINFLNKNFKKKFINTLNKKPKWSIYKQRFWGIPSTNIIYKKKNKYILYNFFSNYYELYGSKYWYKFSIFDTFKLFSVFYKKLYEVLDVWFDSGTTHWHVVRSSHKNILKFPSNLYIEGEDQYRGWFQSSFVTSILLNNKIPFKKIISHNFIKTIYGEKFSKSLNNYIDYKYLINLIGIDILRLLVCNINYQNNIILNKVLLNNTIDIYRKIRNCIRFFMTNISLFKYNFNFLKKNKNNLINKCLFSYFNIIIKKIIKLYNKYNFKKIIIKLKNFLSEDLSCIYFNIIKNYLYLKIINSQKRKLIELNLINILKKFLIIISPILPFTSEEAWFKIFFKKTIFKKKIFIKKNNNKILKNLWLLIKFLKFIFYKNIEIIKNFFIFSNLDIKLYLFINKRLFFFFKKNKRNLINLFSISKININLNKKKNIFFLFKFIKTKKCNRCWIKKKYLHNINICKICYINLYKQLFFSK